MTNKLTMRAVLPAEPRRNAKNYGGEEEIYTRAQYMRDSSSDGMIAHRRYFGQFVTPATIATVVRAIGKEVLIASRDPHMNDIPLAKWDRLVPNLPGSAGFAKAGDYYTLGNGVCLGKEAARQYLESLTITGDV